MIVLVLDREGRVEHGNRYFLELVGTSLEEVRGKDWLETFVAQRHRREVRDLFVELTSGAVVTDSVTPLLAAGGVERWIEWHAQMLRGADGTTAVAYMGLDVTEARAAERRVEQSAARLRDAQRVAKIGSWELDLRTNVLWWSDEVYRLFEIPVGATVASYDAFLTMIHPDDRAAVDAAYRISVERHEPYHIKHRLLLANGVRWVEERGLTYYDDAGVPLRSVGTVQDITAQQLASEQLRQYEHLRATARLKEATIEASFSGIALADLDGRITYVNRALTRIWGSARGEEIIGRSVREFWAEPSQAAAVLDAVEHADAWAGELVARRFDGTTFPVAASAVVLRDDKGAAVQLMCSFIDVREHHQARERLAATESRLAFVFDASSDLKVLVAVRPDGGQVVEAANRSFRAFLKAEWPRVEVEPLGLERRELLARLGLSAEQIAQEDAAFHTCVAHNRAMHYEFRPYSDDRRLVVEISLLPLTLSGDRVTHVLWRGRDVTERALTRRTLETHSEVLLSMGEGVFFVDRQRIIRFANPALHEMFGYRPGELVGQPMNLLDAGSAGDYDARLEQVAAALDAEGVWQGEHSNRRKDGTTFCTRTRITRLERHDSSGDVEWVGVQEDITEQKRIERDLRASLREKELLVREVHHRVKNNLQVVCSLLSLQRDAVSTRTTTEILDDCEARVRNIATVHESLYQSANLADIDLEAHLRTLVSSMALTYSTVASTRFRCETPVVVEIDAAVPIGFIVHELVSNACKHAFPGRAGNIEIVLAVNDGELELTVRDDGIGIGSAARPGALGLNLVTGLASQLDGRFEIWNDRGTVARVRCPLKPRAG